ncbi:RnfH family protein [Gammaproteobacteria bacterium AB-CW1]|uniref:UPF0125 protein VCB98_13820 n=1 Tax=Natronospira elongata TaxID=3110268 RepID=A0AAP6JHJ0_9GAMM|nr:RnfH family protein [Gammaproteobacteria bacterium AB-CW1]
MAGADASKQGIRVEVAYARPDRQQVITVIVAAGTTARQAVEQSGILDQFPEISLGGENRLGIFGRLVGEEQVLREGDRVEIYRPLKADPKEVRRRRAREGRTMRKGD